MAWRISKSEYFPLKTLETSISLSFEVKIPNGCEVKTGFCDQINIGNPGLKISLSTAGFQSPVLAETPEESAVSLQCSGPCTSKDQWS